MTNAPLSRLLTSLPERHRRALEWFERHTAEVLPWPRPLSDGTILASKAKGIYKPHWTKYALSVRTAIGGPYQDLPVQIAADGTWTLNYFQEDLDIAKRDDLFTNRGLIECWQDVVPVGVMLQSKSKPNPRYLIQGLALVSGYDQGYFYLQGVSSAVAERAPFTTSVPGIHESPQLRADLIATAFDPRRIEDARRRTERAIVERQGQGGFRRILLRAYEQRCAVTDCDLEDALEAAHIVPYRGPVTNHPSNGLLLRADVHTLFDYGLVTINLEKDESRLLVSSEIQSSVYGRLNNTLVRRPNDHSLWPSIEALQQHRDRAGF